MSLPPLFVVKERTVATFAPILALIKRALFTRVKNTKFMWTYSDFAPYPSTSRVNVLDTELNVFFFISICHLLKFLSDIFIVYTCKSENTFILL